MKIRLFSIFLLSTLILASCKSSQFYFQENDFTDDGGSVYENVKPGGKIVVLSISNDVYRGRFVHIKDGILRAKEKKGPIYEIPLTEVQYIRAYKTNVVGTVAIVLGLVAFTASFLFE